MKYALFALLFALVISCAKEKKVDYATKNDQEITAYIAKKNLKAQKAASGLYYIIENPGTGAQPTPSSEVTVAYKGYYTDGTVFDQSNAQGIRFPLNGVIKGWTEGIAYFKEGGNGLLLIPAHLGYGSATYSGIPGGSVLIFDVKLITVH
ncbi:FKBP-type peptidyl-prolyl cis-trans isomerase [Flavobacterium crassostreae]|uniref:Peptidyl-prolyl cis-trans isomerase n=1 Tax=Flavobacterium crassostreae TaxID=1763534 RepID=A0A1B9E5P2_9FLAO|nr:FKBP-type peptidyl-prolyl cis-trans isomerase [Flavobacterium crassostreae]OCB77251.1 peptidylprolyl isomerase [Flavobacterium crassostreae]